MKNPVWRYGMGALLADEPFEGLTEELTGETAKDYGARYMIAESMSLGAAQAIARAFGATLSVEKAKGQTNIETPFSISWDAGKLGIAGFQVGDTVRSLRKTQDHEGAWRVVERRPSGEFQKRSRIIVARPDDEAVRFFDPEDMFELIELSPPRLVEIVYFKPGSGKYYTEDKEVSWPRDPSHYTGWATFTSLHRIKDMFAVCLETPLGFPHASPPRGS